MGFPVRVCALVGKFTDSRVAESAHALAPFLQSRKVEVILSENARIAEEPAGVTRVPEAGIGERADLVIAIGGDGTLLYAAGLVARHDVPLLGVNRGRLGFLTDVMPNECFRASRRRCEGSWRWITVHCSRPACTAPAAAGRKPSHSMTSCCRSWRPAHGRFSTHINGVYVNTHAGDGIVVASATGSTAYALSCGGPIVEPHLDVVVLAPICPHTMSDRPIVVSASSTIEVQLLERPDTRAQVTCDGIVLGEIEPGDRLQVRAASERITLLHPVGHDYYRLLRSKLHWGRGSFER